MLKELLGITMIVTVQRDSEQPQEVKNVCKANGIKHKHIPLEGANRPLLSAKKTQAQLKTDFRALFELMTNNKEKVLVHCAAGIHRTGITGYTLLRWSGLSQEKAMDTIKGIREDTHRGVGDWRIELAEEFIVN